MLTTIKRIKPGSFFAVKSASLGDVAFKKAASGEPTHTRLSDGVFTDETFGPGTVVKMLTHEQGVKLAEANRAGIYAEITKEPAKADPALMKALAILLPDGVPFTPPAFFLKDGGTTSAGQMIYVIDPTIKGGSQVIGKRRTTNVLTSALVSCTDRAKLIKWLKQQQVEKPHWAKYFDEQIREHEDQINFNKRPFVYKVESFQGRADLAHKALLSAVRNAEKEAKVIYRVDKPFVYFATATFPNLKAKGLL